MLRAHPNDLEAPRVRFNRFVPKGFLRYMEPEDHVFYKQQFRSLFGSAVLEQIEPALQQVVREALMRLADESARHPATGVAPRPALREIVFELLVAAFFGLRSDADDFQWLRARYEELDLRKTPPSKKILTLMLGPSGKLRAPTMRVGDTLYVGFPKEGFEALK